MSPRCLIIGASDEGSIGYACARAFLSSEKGSVVTIMARDEGKVAAAVEKLMAEDAGQKEGRVYGVVGDLKRPETMKSVVEAAVVKMGGLDVLVIGGGNGGSEYLGLDPDDLASYRMLHDVGVLSPLVLTEAAVPEFKKAGGGAVVMVSSLGGDLPWPSTLPHNLSKAAENSLVRQLAFKYREDRIRVNGVLTACIHTKCLDRMAVKKGVDVAEYAALRARAHPMQRCGGPDEVAQAVLFLSLPACSSYTTGELLKVDGGLALSNWFNLPTYLAEFRGGEKATA